jgi:hypothetical protein
MKYTKEQIEELSEQAVLEIIKDNATLKQQMEVADKCLINIKELGYDEVVFERSKFLAVKALAKIKELGGV